MCWRKISISLLCLFFVIYSGEGQEEVFTEANEAYQSEQYSKAIKLYLTMEEEGGATFGSYYNLGNAHAHLGQISQAILAYEKAALVDQTPELDINLTKVRSQVENSIPEFSEFFIIRYWKQINRLLPPNIWALFAVVLGLVLLYLLYRKWVVSLEEKGKELLSAILVLLLIVVLLSLTSARMEENRLYGIIMTENVILYEGSDERSGEIRDLSAGIKVRVITELNDWLKVELPDKEIGWLRYWELGLVEK